MNKQNKKHSNTQSKVETNVHDSDKKSYANIDSHQWFFMEKKHAQFNGDWKRFLYQPNWAPNWTQHISESIDVDYVNKKSQLTETAAPVEIHKMKEQ